MKKHFREAWTKSVSEKEKISREEERARKLARACEAREEDEARDKAKWPCVTQ